MRWWWIVLVLAGCDREPVVAPTPRKMPVTVVEVTRLTPLPPDRRTHVTSNQTGQIYWVQEAERGREVVFALSEGGVPSATRFTNQSVLEALGAANGTGSIQSLAAGRDGKLYFYFSGGAGRRTLAAVGWFNPAGGDVKILADVKKLTEVSGLGASLALARGSLVWVGSVPWLWLRHEEGYALLTIDLVGGGMRRMFERVRSGEEPLKLTSGREDLMGAVGGLSYLDRATGRVWKISTLGDASVARSVVDLPKEVTAPQLAEGGREVMFAPEAPPFKEVDPTLPQVMQPAKFPALVVVGAGGQTMLERDRFEPPLRQNVTPGQLVRDRSAWLLYDGQAGELLRIRVVER